MTQNKEKLIDKFTDIKSIINLNIVKCYKELFTINGLKNNIGNYILLVMIFLNLICLISFLVKGYKLLIKTIYDLVEQKMNIVRIKNVETTKRLITRNRKKDKDKLIDKLSANIAQKTKINKYDKIKSTNIKKNKKIKKIEINSNKLNNKYQKNKKIINTKIK